jgi:hypothetical protein
VVGVLVQERVRDAVAPAGRHHDEPASAPTAVAAGRPPTALLLEVAAVDDPDRRGRDLVAVGHTSQHARVPVHVDPAGAHVQPDRPAVGVPPDDLGRLRLAGGRERRACDGEPSECDQRTEREGRLHLRGRA